jgi:ribosomal protein S4
LNKKEITIPAGTVKKGDVVSISTIHNKAPNPLTAEESNAYKYLQDNSERGFWIKEQLKEFAIGYAVRKHEELSSQQNAELKKDNESFQKFKERCNGLDPIKVIEVAAKHSSFELILEHVMRSIEIESLRKKSAEMMRILELWEVATRGVNIPDEMNDIEFFAADKATDQFFKSLTGDKEKGVNNE